MRFQRGRGRVSEKFQWRTLPGAETLEKYCPDHGTEISMSQVAETIDVNVPVRTAYDQWTQFESFPEFMSGVESITQVDDTRNHWVTSVGGVKREFDTQITDQKPDERIEWQTVGGETKHGGIVTFQVLDPNTTRITVNIEWQPEGFVEKVGDTIGADDRRVKADLKKFKHFIEERGADTGGWRGEVD